MKLFCGAGNAAFTGNGEKILEYSYVHIFIVLLGKLRCKKCKIDSLFIIYSITYTVVKRHNFIAKASAKANSKTKALSKK